MGSFKMKCLVDNCSNKYYAKGYGGKHYQTIKKYGNTIGIKSQAPIEERFWRFVDKKESNECWNWTSNLCAGYGRISLGAKKDGATGSHRFSWELHNKQSIPSGMVVMHSCDNPLCVNPSHLNVGTYKDNTQDMITKGRKVTVAPLGTENGKAIINEEIVKAIRASNLSHVDLGKQFNVSVGCVRGVRSGRTWSHVI